MSLTKEQLLEKAKPRFELIDVEGWGEVGIRTCPQLQLSRRYVTYSNEDGSIAPDEHAKSGLHKLIDQLMIDEQTPMFTDEDEEQLAILDPAKLSPIYDAIDTFNGEEPKKP